MRVLVKGDIEQAIAAATLRGITVAGWAVGRHETALIVEEHHHSAVVSWFLESAVAPYPPGTALWYQA